jgi:hypothetical protein
MATRMNGRFSLLLFLAFAAFAFAQEEAVPVELGPIPWARDPEDFIGWTLGDVFAGLGPPNAVYAVRGEEAWQDDVVFVYDGIDLYVSENRVWQAGVQTARGVSQGDPKAAVLFVLGGKAQDGGGHILLSVSNRPWPLAIRYNLDAAGKVRSIYIYRPDY